jgi:hypothetical protein
MQTVEVWNVGYHYYSHHRKNHRMSSIDHITYIDKGEGSPKCDEPGNYQSCNGGLVIGLLPLQTNKHKVERQVVHEPEVLQPESSNKQPHKQTESRSPGFLRLYFKLFGPSKSRRANTETNRFLDTLENIFQSSVGLVYCGLWLICRFCGNHSQ